MLILFFVVWGLDAFILNYSTVFVDCIPFFPRLFLAILTISIGGYVAMKAHRVVFNDQPTLLDIGVYAWVRHPLYLGILLVCLGFLLAVPSIFALTIWITFFLIYDKMATYEETDLKRILGADYAAYQQRVPKWLPRLVRQS